MKKLLLIILALLSYNQASGQKWFKKVRKAQVNVMTYGADGQLLRSSNAFIVGEDGMALSDYTTFRGATRAVVIDDQGKQYEVDYVAGASSLYDVVRFHIANIKASAVKIAPAASQKEQTAYLMPYLSNKAGTATPMPIVEVTTFNDRFSYYTLSAKALEKSASCPVLNEQGEVIGLLQMAAKDADKQCFVLDANYPLSLTTTALSATANDYRDIGIRKALPADAAQASSFIYLVGTRDTAIYLSYVDAFIAAFPNEANGYTMKAEMLAAKGDYETANETWAAGIKATASEAELLYSRARTIFATIQAQRTPPEDWTLERALTDIDAALAIDSQPVYIGMKGHILYALKQYSEACASFLDLSKTNLRSAENFLYAAQCQQMLGDTLNVLELQDSAIACFTKPYISEAATPLLMRANTLISLNRKNISKYDKIILKNIIRRVSIQTIEQLRRGG